MGERLTPTAQLEQLRAEINKCDFAMMKLWSAGRSSERRGQLQTLLTQRDGIVHRIGAVKREIGQPPLNENRKTAHLQELVTYGRKLGISERLVERGYAYLHTRAIRIQEGQRT